MRYMVDGEEFEDTRDGMRDAYRKCFDNSDRDWVFQEWVEDNFTVPELLQVMNDWGENALEYLFEDFIDACVNGGVVGASRFLEAVE